MDKITVPVVDKSGKEVGSMDLDPADFGGTINKQLLHDVVVMYQANKRQGTSRTKGRSDVVGSTKKLFRQKGTGNARMGNKRTPIRRGGGTAHPKLPRDYSYRMPKKMVKSATRMALLSKFVDSEAMVIDSLEFSEPRTREMVAVLESLNLAGESCLVTAASSDVVLWKSARNIPRVTVTPARELNALDLLKQKRLLITREALELLAKGAGGSESGAAE